MGRSRSPSPGFWHQMLGVVEGAPGSDAILAHTHFISKDVTQRCATTPSVRIHVTLKGKTFLHTVYSTLLEYRENLRRFS